MYICVCVCVCVFVSYMFVANRYSCLGLTRYISIPWLVCWITVWADEIHKTKIEPYSFMIRPDYHFWRKDAKSFRESRQWLCHLYMASCGSKFSEILQKHPRSPYGKKRHQAINWINEKEQISATNLFVFHQGNHQSTVCTCNPLVIRGFDKPHMYDV